MIGSTLTPRPLSFVSSFAQTENDANESPVSADMVDLGVMPMTIAEAADEVFLSVPTIMDDDCHMSDASSLYQTFDEVYEMDDRNVDQTVTGMEEVSNYLLCLNHSPMLSLLFPQSKPSRSSSSASDTAPIVPQIDHNVPYSDSN